MSVNPVPPLPTVADRDQPAAQPHAGTPAPAASTGPDSGTSQKTERIPAQSVPSPSEIPEDEVEVQRDSQTNGDIVVRYVDHSGNVVLQVPSEQVLGVARAIDEDLQRQQAHAEAAATAESHEGGK